MRPKARPPAKKSKPRLNRDERKDAIIFTGRLLHGWHVSLKLLPEEFERLLGSPVCGDPCEHLHVLHNAGDGPYICEICIDMGRESGGVTKREKEKLRRIKRAPPGRKNSIGAMPKHKERDDA